VSIFPPAGSYFATDSKRMNRPRPRTMLRSVAVLALLLGGATRSGLAAPTGADETIPDDARLGPARASLQATVAKAGAGGLPTRPLIVKVREGLAKGVPPERIAAAVESLARGLDEANHFARAQGRGPSAALLTALADLHARGVTWDSAAPVITAHADEAAMLRAVDVLGELATRGYPERPAGQLLRGVEEREPAAIGRLVPALESIRRGLTVSRADALDEPVTRRDGAGRGSEQVSGRQGTRRRRGRERAGQRPGQRPRRRSLQEGNGQGADEVAVSLWLLVHQALPRAQQADAEVNAVPGADPRGAARVLRLGRAFADHAAVAA